MNHLPATLNFQIHKHGRHCEIYCPQLTDQAFSLELMDATLVLPEKVVIQQQGHRQIMRLPAETIVRD